MGIDNLGYNVRAGGGLRLAYPSEEQVVQGDAILPAQFYNGRRGGSGLEPVKRLMMAVLVNAIGSYQRNLGAKAALKRREFKEAECWLFEDKRDGVFSFEHICGILNTDANHLRQAIVHRCRARITGVAPRRISRYR